MPFDISFLILWRCRYSIIIVLTQMKDIQNQDGKVFSNPLQGMRAYMKLVVVVVVVRD